ncbi:hypothetical protein ACROYT_G032411 [Oculina patagonica]
MTGNDSLMLTQRQINKLNKAKKLGVGSDLNISKTQIRKVIRVGHGAPRIGFPMIGISAPKMKTRSRRSTTNKSTTDNTSKKDGGNIRLPSKKDVLTYTPPPFIGSWDEYDKFLRTDLKKQHYAYHGTTQQAWHQIQLTGLKPMNHCSVPDPIAVYPLNDNYTTKEIKGRQPPGIATGVSLADGPDGKPNGSYRFYGNNTSYIEFPNNGSLKVDQSITMLCWVNFLPSEFGPLFVYGGDSQIFVGMFISGNELFARFTDKEDRSRPNKLSTGLEFKRWHYVGASYDHDTGNASLWVNGTRRTQETFTAGMTLVTGNNVRMGSILRDNTWYNFTGRITALQVYDFALTKEQIEAVKYDAGQDSLLLGVIYKDLHELLSPNPSNSDATKNKRIGVKACVVMVPLLGVTWLFGLLTPLHKAFFYIFTILNTAQIKDRFKRRINAIFPSADNGNSARKSSQVNPSDIGTGKRIEVQSRSNSVFELK